jgi:hypothetical protein
MRGHWLSAMAPNSREQTTGVASLEVGVSDDTALSPVQQTIWTDSLQIRVQTVLFEALR